MYLRHADQQPRGARLGPSALYPFVAVTISGELSERLLALLPAARSHHRDSLLFINPSLQDSCDALEEHRAAQSFPFCTVIQPQARDYRGCGQNFKSGLQPECTVLRGTDLHGANHKEVTVVVFSGDRAWGGLTDTAVWPPWPWAGDAVCQGCPPGSSKQPVPACQNHRFLTARPELGGK